MGCREPRIQLSDRAVTRLHSATSLRLMARDPLAFLWRYAIDMRPVALAEMPLALDPLAFGELVHELLARTIDALEPKPGFVRASRDEIELALTGAVDHVDRQWPLERAVPPTLLWKHSLDEAARRGLRGLTVDERFEADTTSWSEVGFGLEIVPEGAQAPWPLDGEILVGTTKLRLSGRIDRVDFAAGGRGVRISDYKTGKPPRRPEHIVVDRGKELQRVLYATAVGQLVPDCDQDRLAAHLPRRRVTTVRPEAGNARSRCHRCRRFPRQSLRDAPAGSIVPRTGRARALQRDAPRVACRPRCLSHEEGEGFRRDDP